MLSRREDAVLICYLVGWFVFCSINVHRGGEGLCA